MTINAGNLDDAEFDFDGGRLEKPSTKKTWKVEIEDVEGNRFSFELECTFEAVSEWIEQLKKLLNFVENVETSIRLWDGANYIVIR